VTSGFCFYSSFLVGILFYFPTKSRVVNKCSCSRNSVHCCGARLISGGYSLETSLFAAVPSDPRSLRVPPDADPANLDHATACGPFWACCRATPRSRMPAKKGTRRLKPPSQHLQTHVCTTAQCESFAGD
jgi:hypothetical protein